MSSSLEQLQTEVAKILERDTVNPDETLAELGIDSLNIVELILVCEQLYTSMVDPETLEFDEHTTLKDIDITLNSAEIVA